jgi:hypothetical protein
MRTIYEANDGSHFDSSEECQQHDLQTKFSKYKNYAELNEDINDLYIGNNTDLPSMVAFVIDNIELINNMITADLKQVDKSEEFTADLKPIVKSGEFMAGQIILVRDHEFDDWEEKVFVRFKLNDIYRYECESCEGCIDDWKYAKSL